MAKLIYSYFLSFLGFLLVLKQHTGKLITFPQLLQQGYFVGGGYGFHCPS